MVDRMDDDPRKPPAQANPTGRALPTHGRFQGATTAQRSAFATVEGPIDAGSIVTQRFERNSEGRFERQIAGALLLATNAIVERGRGGDTIRVDVGRFDALWARYDDGDYGTGDAARACYEIDVAGVPTPVLLVDLDREQNPGLTRPTHGPQRIVPA
jgi:hypothetical protein